MKTIPFLASITLLLATFGCASKSIEESAAARLNRQAKKEDSPYRYRVQEVRGRHVLQKYLIVPPRPVAVPPNLQPSVVDAKLQMDVITRIFALQQGWGDASVPTLLGTQPISHTGEVIKEAWFIKRREGASRYEITLMATPDGVRFEVFVPGPH